MSIIDEIKVKVRMVDLLSSYGIEKTRGTNIYCCPFHGDKHPSANINKVDDRFHCFVCNESLDIFDFVQQQEGCDLSTAIKVIDDRFRLGLARRLSEEERREVEILRLKREKERRAKIEQAKWELAVRNRICADIRMWERVADCTYPRWKKWNDLSDTYMYATKEVDRLSALYDLLCGITPNAQPPTRKLRQNAVLCELAYTYGTKPRAIYEKIKNGEIKI